MDKVSRDSIVTQANQLIEGAFDITLIEMRLLYLALTKVDSRNPQPEGEYTLFAKEYKDMFSLGESSYDQIKTAVNSLARKPIITYEFNEAKQRVNKVQRFWFSSISYGASGNSSDITLRFSDTVRDYLYELRNEFTQMNLVEMVKLESPFAFRLYSWLFKYRRLTNSKNAQGVISTNPLTLDWMKERTGLLGKYPELNDFRRRVLDPAIDMINAHTHISVYYELKKRGRKIDSVVFNYIDEKEQPPGYISHSKPLRPRLPNRPHVTKGSVAEGEWARKCITTMKEYQSALKTYDDTLSISGADRKKVMVWHEIIGLQMKDDFWQ